MKFKYYLRGAGVGIIITTLVLTIAFSKEKKEYEKANASDIAITSEETKDSKDAKDDKAAAEEEKEKLNQSKDTAKQEANQAKDAAKQEDKKIELSISGGDSSIDVANRLKEKGLIDDAEAYDKYLAQNHLDNLLQTGTHEIPAGSSYEEIAKILTTKKEK